MLSCDKVLAGDLTANDLALWRDMQAATPAFYSPLLSPDFTQAVARVRDDVRVLVFRRHGKVVAFLPVHMRPGCFARPVGAPFSDYSALITFPDPDLTMTEALQAAGIHRYQAIGLVDPYNVFGEIVDGEIDEASGIDLRDEAPESNANKKLLKNIRRISRHLEDDHGPVRFIAGDRDPLHFETMLKLKRQQTRDTGLHDFLEPEWVQQLLKNLFAAPESGLHGFMLTLTAGDTPVLYHFGVRLGDRAHPWVSSYDSAFASYSPGQIFLNGLHEPLRQAGVSYYDLSTGQQGYKAIFSNTRFPVTHALIYSGAGPARFHAGIDTLSAGARKAMGPKVDDAFRRLRRRFDHIATLELDTMSRLRGVAYAFSSASRRRRVSE